ncbi:uncharacterized protein C2845_PM13G18260 [Panicum miliaceum]|uniref:At1g61320/AtMIF1 LRR domain-containing protein n=1 Tax=Panicum miliaceum TaxID=4540 RepID=A0A3L6RNT0_PANMI|nr:uncharacterized protein C2845_PM13G18260 [Panicum miliaceum]
MPLRDAARAACLSHAFLRSWRCYSNLTFNKDALRPEACIYSGDFRDAVDRIMRNHSGIDVKILELRPFCIAYCNLNSWLQVAVKPGIEELTLRLCHLFRKKYKFPWSLLSDGVRNSLRYLELGCCTFHPTAKLGPLRSLTSLHLSHVRITGDELQGLLSNSLALDKLELIGCKGIICLRIPCELQCFSYLLISACMGLKLIESKAPNLSTLDFCGKPKLLLGEALQMKKLSMYNSDVVCYARTELPSIMPNLDTLELCSTDEVVNTPMLPTRFLCLKRLTIYLISGPFPLSHDYFSLLSFLDASRSLETLSLGVQKKPMEDELVSGNSSQLRQMAENQHCHLKNVKITGFSSAKGLVELTCYILKNAVSLECLTLDVNYGSTGRCFDSLFGRCSPLGNGLRVARRALVSIRTYIKDKDPARVKLTVVEPCSRCHKLS